MKRIALNRNETGCGRDRERFHSNTRPPHTLLPPKGNLVDRSNEKMKKENINILL